MASPASEPGAEGEKATTSGAAAAPLADKKEDAATSDDEEEYLKEFERVKQQQAAAEKEDEGGYEDEGDQFEESPRQKVGSQGLASSGQRGEEEEDGAGSEEGDRYPDDGSPEDEEEPNEEEVIDVAEKIFIRMAEELIKQGRTSIRDCFTNQIFETMIGDDYVELLSPIGLLEGIKELGIDDLEEKEITYLLRVLTKPELDGAILVEELLQIMENFGLYDEGQMGAGTDHEPDGETPDGAGLKTKQKSDVESSPEAGQTKKKKEKPMDFSKLDQKSIKIMVMLMLHLLDAGLTTQEFFEEVTYQQSVQSKTKHQTLEIMKAEDFFRVLYERGIRNKDAEHQNLKEFLQLSTSHPHLLVLKSIKRTLEQMAENERFMEAIREDIMKGEEKAREEAERAQEDLEEEAALDRIRRGVTGPQ